MMYESGGRLNECQRVVWKDERLGERLHEST